MSWAVATVDWLRRLYGDWRGLRDDTYDTVDEILNRIEPQRPSPMVYETRPMHRRFRGRR